MDGFFQNYPNAKKNIIIGAIVLVIVIIGLASYNIYESSRNHYGKSMRITDFSSTVRSLSKDQRDNIEHQLSEIVSKNSGDTSARDVKIRQDSLFEEKDYVSFFLDIDSIKQSYFVQVDLTGGSTGYPVIVSCIFNDAEKRYEDFVCKDIFSDNDDAETNKKSKASWSLKEILPYTGELPNGASYTLDAGYIDGKPAVIVKTNNCGKESIKKEAIKAAKNYLKTKEINPDDYLYDSPSIYDNCTVE